MHGADVIEKHVQLVGCQLLLLVANNNVCQPWSHATAVSFAESIWRISVEQEGIPECLISHIDIFPSEANFFF